jgi:hypothetical protein
VGVDEASKNDDAMITILMISTVNDVAMIAISDRANM